MKYVQLVLKNLLRNRRRTILTVLSIGVSLFIFSALISLRRLQIRSSSIRHRQC
jgi:cell division protein FtsX